MGSFVYGTIWELLLNLISPIYLTSIES